MAESKPKSRFANEALTVITALIVLYTVWRLWSVLTNISPFPDTSVPATAMPQILSFSVGNDESRTVGDFPVYIRAISAISIACEAAMAIILLLMTRTFTRRVADRSAFSADISSELRKSATAVFVLAAVRLVADIGVIAMVKNFLAGRWQDVGYGIGQRFPSISLIFLIGALVCLVLASAIDHGSRLERDVDGLV